MGTPLPSVPLLLSQCPPWGWGDLEMFGSLLKSLGAFVTGLPVSEPHKSFIPSGAGQKSGKSLIPSV